MDYQYANGRRGDWRPLSNLSIENEVDLYSRAGILYNGANTSEEKDAEEEKDVEEEEEDPIESLSLF